MITSLPPPLRVHPDDPAYLERAQAESEFWRTSYGFGVDAASREHPNDPLKMYTNRRFTGDPHKRWIDEIPEYGTFRSGLILGASGITQDVAILECNPSVHLTICDISQPALDQWEASLRPRFVHRVAFRRADLNFDDLPPGAYDLIVSSSTLHHVINLEHAAWHINRALTPDGMFFMQDYAGEDALHPSETKRLLFTLISEREERRHGRVRGVHWKTGDEMRLSPFCRVRSSDVLPVLATYLEPIKVRTAGALLALMMDSRPAEVFARPTWVRFASRIARRAMRMLGRPQPAISRQLLEELALVGDVLTDAGVLLPADTYGVYRKRTSDDGIGRIEP